MEQWRNRLFSGVWAVKIWGVPGAQGAGAKQTMPKLLTAHWSAPQGTWPPTQNKFLPRKNSAEQKMIVMYFSFQKSWDMDKAREIDQKLEFSVLKTIFPFKKGQKSQGEFFLCF